MRLRQSRRFVLFSSELTIAHDLGAVETVRHSKFKGRVKLWEVSDNKRAPPNQVGLFYLTDFIERLSLN